ncbi:MAG: hypothetical protein HONBIEJF_01094 [Fimbriimonadaceae bacterium]|nr:hypothetical protein [Fimbriimonadaceae bacterium]
MKKGSLALLFAVAAALLVLPYRALGPELLQDTDTAVLLDAISRRGNPLSWFVGDWPLQNHFYRPISTLFFELDYRLYGDAATGFGWTNAVLASICVIGTYFAIRAWTANAWIGACAAWLLALWLLPQRISLEDHACFIGFLVLTLSVVRQRLLLPGLLAAAGIVLLGSEIGGQSPLHYRIVHWLPGRTASVMTVFGLAAIALFLAQLRSQPRHQSAANPYDIPATKSTEAVKLKEKNLLPWATVALLAALGSYEQAVTLPFVLLIAYVGLLAGRREAKREWMMPLGCLLVYVAVRLLFVPVGVSGYQAQQFRDGPGVWLALGDYLLPGYRGLQSAWILATSGPQSVFLPELYLNLIAGLSGTVLFGYLLVRTRNQMGMWLWPASFIAFLPMAWLKPFDHYHLFPMALRAGFIAWLVFTVGAWVATAISPRPRQAPPRSCPAPGSLPRR